MRTSLDLCFCLLTLCGVTSVLCAVEVFVGEGSDAVLPCLISTEEDITGQTFFWRKDGQKEKKEVFFYDSGLHYNNGLTGQDEQFRGRVSHFQDQLKNGNASIKIQNTKMADSGSYRCIFPRLQPSQTSIIELVVEPFLRDRSGEIPGAAPKLYVTTLDETHDWSLLQCEVQGASPEPKVEWKDSSGNILPAERPQVSERGGRYDVTININVTKTGRYRCEVTQEENSQQTYSEIFVQLHENLSREVKHWRSATTLAAVLALVLPLVVAAVCCISKWCRLRSKHLCNQIMKSCERLWKKLSFIFPKLSYSHPQNIHPPDETEVLMPDELTPMNADHQSSNVTESNSHPQNIHPPDETEVLMPVTRNPQEKKRLSREWT